MPARAPGAVSGSTRSRGTDRWEVSHEAHGYDRASASFGAARDRAGAGRARERAAMLKIGLISNPKSERNRRGLAGLRAASAGTPTSCTSRSTTSAACSRSSPRWRVGEDPRGWSMRRRHGATGADGAAGGAALRAAPGSRHPGPRNGEHDRARCRLAGPRPTAPPAFGSAPRGPARSSVRSSSAASCASRTSTGDRPSVACSSAPPRSTTPSSSAAAGSTPSG